MKHGLASALVVSLLLWGGANAIAEERPQHVELLLKIDKQSRITVLRQTLRRGRVSGPKHPELREGAWTLQARDAGEEEVFFTAIPDPRTVYADWLEDDPARPGHQRLTGSMVQREDAVFSVRIPHDPRIKHLLFKRLTRNVQPLRGAAPPGRRGQADATAEAVGEPRAPEIPEDAVESIDSLAIEVPADAP